MNLSVQSRSAGYVILPNTIYGKENKGASIDKSMQAKSTILFLKTLVILTLTGATFQNLYAQDVKSIGDSLRRAGIDTFLVYSDHSGGQVEYKCLPPRNYSPTDKRKYPHKEIEPIYAFYKKNGKINIQKINNCQTFKTIIADTCVELNFILTHADTLANEEILQYITKEGTTIVASHTRHSQIYFSVGKTTGKFSVTGLDFSSGLNSGSLTDEPKNINYQHNINTKRRELLLLLDERIKQINFVSE